MANPEAGFRRGGNRNHRHKLLRRQLEDNNRLKDSCTALQGTKFPTGYFACVLRMITHLSR